MRVVLSWRPYGRHVMPRSCFERKFTSSYIKFPPQLFESIIPSTFLKLNSLLLLTLFTIILFLVTKGDMSKRLLKSVF